MGETQIGGIQVVAVSLGGRIEYWAAATTRDAAVAAVTRKLSTAGAVIVLTNRHLTPDQASKVSLRAGEVCRLP
jgi:hypothetical protein